MKMNHFISACLISILLLHAISCSNMENKNVNPVTSEEIIGMVGTIDTNDMDPQRITDQQKSEVARKVEAIAVDTSQYSFHFRDIYGDYFYFNEKTSYYGNYRLFEGLWNTWGNNWYQVTMMYHIPSNTVVVNAEYQSDQVFYYHCRATSTPGYYTGAFTYLLIKSGYTNKVRGMNMVFTKGSL